MVNVKNEMQLSSYICKYKEKYLSNIIRQKKRIQSLESISCRKVWRQQTYQKEIRSEQERNPPENQELDGKIQH